VQYLRMPLKKEKEGQKENSKEKNSQKENQEEITSPACRRKPQATSLPLTENRK